VFQGKRKDPKIILLTRVSVVAGLGFKPVRLDVLWYRRASIGRLFLLLVSAQYHIDSKTYFLYFVIFCTLEIPSTRRPGVCKKFKSTLEIAPLRGARIAGIKGFETRSFCRQVNTSQLCYCRILTCLEPTDVLPASCKEKANPHLLTRVMYLEVWRSSGAYDFLIFSGNKGNNFTCKLNTGNRSAVSDGFEVVIG
jgi:hypothetical protein